MRARDQDGRTAATRRCACLFRGLRRQGLRAIFSGPAATLMRAIALPGGGSAQRLPREAGRTARYVHRRRWVCVGPGTRRRRQQLRPSRSISSGGSTAVGGWAGRDGTLPSAFARFGHRGRLSGASPTMARMVTCSGGRSVHQRLSGWLAAHRWRTMTAPTTCSHLVALDGERERIPQNLARWQARFLDRHELLPALRRGQGALAAEGDREPRRSGNAGTLIRAGLAASWSGAAAATVARRHHREGLPTRRASARYGFAVTAFWQPRSSPKRAKSDEEKAHANAVRAEPYGDLRRARRHRQFDRRSRRYVLGPRPRTSTSTGATWARKGNEVSRDASSNRGAAHAARLAAR